MGRSSIVPQIMTVLEPWLESRMSEWRVQPVENRTPTLPRTAEGKVDVRNVTRALGLKVSQEQHFYNHVELTRLVNAAAEEQGLNLIGSRTKMDADDKAVAVRLSRVQTEHSNLARSLAEREAVIERQRREIATLREQLQLRDETGMVLRTARLQTKVGATSAGKEAK